MLFSCQTYIRQVQHTRNFVNFLHFNVYYNICVLKSSKMDNKASNKRALEPDSSEEPSEIKRSKIDIGLLDLSDCVLTLIFEYVNSFDLYALSLTCTRFNFLIPAKILWSHVDTRNNPMCGRKFKFFYSNLNDTTRTLMVSGINQNEKCITNYQFQRLGKITSNLTVLAMEYQLINSSEVIECTIVFYVLFIDCLFPDTIKTLPNWIEGAIPAGHAR